MRRLLPCVMVLLTGCGRELVGPIAAPPAFVHAQIHGERLSFTECRIVPSEEQKIFTRVVKRTVHIEQKQPDGTVARVKRVESVPETYAIKSVRYVAVWVERDSADLNKYQLLYADGELIPRGQWAELLRNRTLVLHCERFDLYYTQLVRSDTLVLVGPPLPRAAPQGEEIAPAAPAVTEPPRRPTPPPPLPRK